MPAVNPAPLPHDASATRVTLISEATAGGMLKHLRYLAGGLLRAGFAVDLILSPRGADAAFADDVATWRSLGCHVTLLPMRKSPGPWDVVLLARLKAALRARPPAIVHTHCAKAGLAGRIAARAVNPAIRTVHTPHSWFFQGQHSTRLAAAGIRLERWLGARTDLLLCIGEAERDLALQHRIVPPSRIALAPNGLPDDFTDYLATRAEARKRFAVASTAVGVVLLSRLVARKGLMLVPDAAARLSYETRFRLRFFFLGDGPQRAALEQHVEDLDLRLIVSFFGHQIDGEQWLPGFDIAVVPSVYEGLSYSLLEALAAGLAVVATDVPGNRLGIPGNPIVYVPPGDATALAAALTRLSADADLRRELGERGRQWIRTAFRLDDQIATIADAYRRLLNGA